LPPHPGRSAQGGGQLTYLRRTSCLASWRRLPSSAIFEFMNVTHSALVVDDERDIRELLVLTLGRMGLRISTAANLAEARELLASNHFDLCLTDMRLPDGNGIELV